MTLTLTEGLCGANRISPLHVCANRVAKSVEGSLRARSATRLVQSASHQPHRRAVSDGFGAEDVDTSGTSVHRYRRCLSISKPFRTLRRVDAPWSFRPGTSHARGYTGKPVTDRGTLEDLSQSAQLAPRSVRKLLILSGEMSEWLKEHAWKASRSTDRGTYRRTSSPAVSTTWLPKDVSRCLPVSVGVFRWLTPISAQSGAQFFRPSACQL